MTACGSHASSPSNLCTGAAINGTLHDSLTEHPVQGIVSFEPGSQVLGSSLYNFSVTQNISTDTNGNFQLCEPAVAVPSVVVVTALDSSNNAYPPFVASVTGATSFGTIPMGSCTLVCGQFPGQQQTSPPATIQGIITTVPIAKSGSVLTQYALLALDGSTNLWNLAMPAYNASGPVAFTTTAAKCTSQSLFCADYTFVLPSQKPVVSTKTGTMQEAGAPDYSINAVIPGTPSCIPPSAFTYFQQNGTSPLTAAPGAQLVAAPINLAACQ